MIILLKAYATKGGTGLGRWVTINGSPVFIEGGTVTKGPSALVGKNFSKDVTSTKVSRHNTSMKHTDGNTYKMSSQEYRENKDIFMTPQKKLNEAIKYAGKTKVEFAKSLVGAPKEDIVALTYKAMGDKNHPLHKARRGAPVRAAEDVVRLVNLFEEAAKET